MIVMRGIIMDMMLLNEIFYPEKPEIIGENLYSVKYRNYNIRLRTFSKMNFLIDVAVYGKNQSLEQSAVNYIKALHAEIPCNYKNDALNVLVPVKEGITLLKNVLDEITAYFTDNGFSPCDIIIEEPKFRSESANTADTSGKLKSRKKENVILGLIGALIGTIPGIILWIIIGQLGFVAALCGALISLGALTGYAYFGKGFGRAGMVISGLTIILAAFLAICLNYTVYIMRYQQISFALSIYILKIMVTTISNFRADFIKSIALGYLFTFIGAFTVYSKLRLSK
jgi:hypothetical protein